MAQSIASHNFKPLRKIHVSDKWRSIPTCYPTKKLYYPDTLNDEEQKFASNLADATSHIDYVEAKKDRWYQYGDNENLEFCFHAVDIPKTRFSPGLFPVWYAGSDQECSKAEVTFHKIIQANHELQYTKEENEIFFELAFCQAKLKSNHCLDARSLAQSSLPGLLEEGPPYPFCNEFGSMAKARGVEMIHSKSRRWKSGEIWAVFSKDAIVSSIVKAYWDIAVFKSGEVEICKNPIQFKDGWMTYL